MFGLSIIFYCLQNPGSHSFSIGITEVLNTNLLVELSADDIEYVYQRLVVASEINSFSSSVFKLSADGIEHVHSIIDRVLNHYLKPNAVSQCSTKPQT